MIEGFHSFPFEQGAVSLVSASLSQIVTLTQRPVHESPARRFNHPS
jgi:hypothetical protein